MVFNKKARSQPEAIMGLIVLGIILVVLASSGVFSEIINAFSSPEFGSYGKLLGVLFIFLIVATLANKLLEKW